MGQAKKGLPKSLFVLFVLCVLAALLNGCGGTAADATIGGNVTGLTPNNWVALVNNLQDPINVFASGNGNFVFDVPVQSGSTYSVTVTTQPIGENCVVTNGSGTVDQNGDAITNVAVTCTPNN